MKAVCCQHLERHQVSRTKQTKWRGGRKKKSLNHEYSPGKAEQYLYAITV